VLERALVEPECLLERVGLLGVLCSFYADRNCVLEAPCAQEVVCDLDSTSSFLSREEIGRPRMDAITARHHQVVIDRLLCECVAEPKAGRFRGVLFDELFSDGGLEVFMDGRFIEVRHSG
jgi:hypothetical protein